MLAYDILTVIYDFLPLVSKANFSSLFRDLAEFHLEHIKLLKPRSTRLFNHLSTGYTVSRHVMDLYSMDNIDELYDIACSNDYVELLKLLLDCYPCTDNIYKAATFTGNMEVLRAFLECGMLRVDSRDDIHYNLLKGAASADNLEMVKYLLDNKISKITPELITYASYSQGTDVLQFALSAELDLINYNPRHKYSTFNPRTRTFRTAPQGDLCLLNDAVKNACAKFNINAVKMLLSRGAKVDNANAIQSVGMLLSEQPIECEMYEFMKLLVDNGADPSILHRGRCAMYGPFQRAVFGDYTTSVQLLLDCGIGKYVDLPHMLQLAKNKGDCPRTIAMLEAYIAAN